MINEKKMVGYGTRELFNIKWKNRRKTKQKKSIDFKITVRKRNESIE